MMEKGRVCRDYSELQSVFYKIIMEYVGKLKTLIVNNNNRDFLKAKAYIDNHYDENLTLEVLAGEVHMNSYYFNTFFKKNAGENFKDYVSRIRIQHALSLLVSTDLKAYEIALKVGFSDARAFSENFQRIYHETPAAYRKRAKKGEVWPTVMRVMSAACYTNHTESPYELCKNNRHSLLFILYSYRNRNQRNRQCGILIKSRINQ